MALSHIDPARDATVLLIGRGGAYPTLSVALGERTGVVGALSMMMKSSKKFEDPKEKQKLFERICRIDPVQALNC